MQRQLSPSVTHLLFVGIRHTTVAGGWMKLCYPKCVSGWWWGGVRGATWGRGRFARASRERIEFRIKFRMWSVLWNGRAIFRWNVMQRGNLPPPPPQPVLLPPFYCSSLSAQCFVFLFRIEGGRKEKKIPAKKDVPNAAIFCQFTGRYDYTKKLSLPVKKKTFVLPWPTFSHLDFSLLHILMLLFFYPRSESYLLMSLWCFFSFFLIFHHNFLPS